MVSNKTDRGTFIHQSKRQNIVDTKSCNENEQYIVISMILMNDDDDDDRIDDDNHTNYT